MAHLKSLLFALSFAVAGVAVAQPTTTPGLPPSVPVDPPPVDPPPTDPPVEPPPAIDIRMINVSVRGNVRGGAGTLENPNGGFIVRNGSMRVLVQGAGPRLRNTFTGTGANYGIPDWIETPQLIVNQGNRPPVTLIARNDSWATQTVSNINPLPTASGITSVVTAVAAYPFEAGSLDAASLIDVTTGPYTMELVSTTGNTGEGVLGFWVDTTRASTGSFENVSARGVVTPGATGELATGVVLRGNAPARLLAVAIGPGLASLGIPASSALARPTLRVNRFSDGLQVGTNTNWTTASNSAEIRTLLQARGVTLTNTVADSALLLTVDNNNGYVFSASSTGSGIALVGVWLID